VRGTEGDPAPTRGVDAGAHALPDCFGLELGNCGEHGNEEPAHPGRRVDRLRRRDQADVATVEVFDDLKQVAGRPADAIESNTPGRRRRGARGATRRAPGDSRRRPDARSSRSSVTPAARSASRCKSRFCSIVETRA